MTTTANKAGLRAAATKRTAKAAQRTPLPPKDETMALARQAVADAKRDSRPPAKAKTGKAAKAAAVEVPADKAGHYQAEMIKLGWKVEVTRTDGLHELLATRGAEALYLAWMNEAHVGGTSTYTIADRTVKVRNASEMMRIAGLSPTQAKETQDRVAGNKAFVKRPTGPTIRSIPFNVETATDEEIAEALAGHQVQWHNQYRVQSETAIVGRIVHVTRHARGHRIVSFIDPETGYRALRLENLENVGRKVNLDRIKQEILASLMREAKRTERATAKAA